MSMNPRLERITIRPEQEADLCKGKYQKECLYGGHEPGVLNGDSLSGDSTKYRTRYAKSRRNLIDRVREVHGTLIRFVQYQEEDEDEGGGGDDDEEDAGSSDAGSDGSGNGGGETGAGSTKEPPEAKTDESAKEGQEKGDT